MVTKIGLNQDFDRDEKDGQRPEQTAGMIGVAEGAVDDGLTVTGGQRTTAAHSWEAVGTGGRGGQMNGWTVVVAGLVPCGFLLVGLFFVPESPRWLNACLVLFGHCDLKVNFLALVLVDAYQYNRIYSPATFGKKYDPNGNYIRHFLPMNIYQC
ncbi:hypothetical protein ACFE04_010614 [Oxalis oulophora]